MFEVVQYIVFYDLWFYWSHILLHKYLYGKIHSIHHNADSYSMTYMDTLTGHWIENGIQPMGIFIPLTWTKTYHYLLFAWMIVMIRGFLRHDIRAIPYIGNHHLLHHKYPQWNYGEYWLDYTFGTLCPKKNEAIHGWLYV